MGSDTPTSVKPLPALPQRQHSFTSWQTQNPTAPPPGNWLDSELNQAQTTLKATIDWASVSLRSDGSLNPEAVTKALDGSAPDNSANDTALAEAVAMDYAVLSGAWAEYMPGTIPPNILAVMDITGDHWSSRWWANRAANLSVQTGHALTDDLLGVDSDQDLLVRGNAVVEGNLTVGGIIAGASDLTLEGNAIVQGDVKVTGDVFAGSAHLTTAYVTNVYATSAVQGDRLIAFRNAPTGGPIVSIADDWGAGFVVTHAGTLDFGDIDASGAFTRNRMSLDPAGNLGLVGVLSAPTVNVPGAITAGAVNADTLTSYGAINAASGSISGTISADGDVDVHGGLNAGSASIAGNMGVSGYVTADMVAANTLTVRSALTAPTVTVTGTVTAANVKGTLVQGDHVIAFRNATNGGAFISIADDWGAGFLVSHDGALYFGDMNASGDITRNRMSVDPEGVLRAQDAIYAAKEVHAGQFGIYYTGIFNDHAIAFHWTGTQLVGYVDGGSIGPVALAQEAQELRDRVTALEARISVLEAAAP
jgi:cytoskeletal protein CcmA (bactofilin family)